jgi:3-dehydroquinate dehydratase-1
MESGPLVVGTVHTPEGLIRAQSVSSGEVDLIELRLDSLVSRSEEVLEVIPRVKVPLLLTVRHPREGGLSALNLKTRRELYLQFLPRVQWVDVEVRSLGGLAEVVDLAKSQGTKLVVSDHHFEGLPADGRLRRARQRALEAGADVFKLAVHLKGPSDLERLFRFLNRGPVGKLSVMGMGELGQVSRLLCGVCGSVLNYGYLDRPQVGGQWEAVTLKSRLRELGKGLEV